MGSGTVPAASGQCESTAPLDRLLETVREVGLRAAAIRDPSLGQRGSRQCISEELAQAADLADEVRILRHGPESGSDRARLAALLSRAFFGRPLRSEQVGELAVSLVWLAANTPWDALAEPDGAAELPPPFYFSLASIARAPQSFGLSRAEGLFAASVLLGSSSPHAQQAAAELASIDGDPKIKLLLHEPSIESLGPSLRGELESPPRTALATILLGLTGLLLLMHVIRAIKRTALGHRRPAELSLTPHGLELSAQSELLGRVLRRSKVLIPLSGLARITREERYARAGLYGGLAALVVGSYVGVGLIVDGARVPGGSASLLSLGFVIVLLGVALDYGLATWSGSLRTRCRVIVTPHKGHRFCVGRLERGRADALLLALRRRLGQGAEKAP